MKKKFSISVVLVILCLFISASSFPVVANGFYDEKSRVIDGAKLLNESEKNALEEKLNEISDRLSMDIVVATANTLNGYSVRDYADNLYDNSGFGYGNGKDGVLLLVSMEERDWYISTCGYGITAFTTAGIDYIGDEIVPELSEGAYFAAFMRYADLCEEFILQARNGTAYDRGSLPEKPLSLVWIPISLVIGLILALIIVGEMKQKLKTVRSQNMANDYIKSESMKITESRDMFLYHTVTKRPKPKQENHQSGSGAHISSSGTTHGGGGR